MAQARGRAFWLEFLQRHAKSGMSLTDYCAQEGVSYKTARNWSSKLGSELQQGQGQKAGTGTTKRGQGQSSKDNGGKAKGLTKSKGAEKKADSTTGCDQEPISPPQKRGKKTNKGWENLTPFEPGNQAALKHGGYAKYLPPEIRDEINTYGRDDLLSVLEEIKLAKARLLMVTRARAEWEAKAEYSELSDSDYMLTETTKKTGGENDPEITTKRIRPKFEEVEDSLSRRLAWLQQVHDQLSRKISLTADEAIQMRAEILEKAEEEGWSSLDTALEIEKKGLEVPFSLQMKIKAELALIEPEEPEGGLSDDDLEALSAEYEREIEGEARWLEDRRTDVVEIVEKSGSPKGLIGQDDGEAQEVDSPRQEMD